MCYQHSWPGRRDWLTRSPGSFDQVTRSFIVFFKREWQPWIEISPFIDQGSLYWAGSRAPGAEVALPLRGILPGNMGRAGLLALFAADAGTRPPQAEEAEVGRDGEEQAERADPTADRPVYKYGKEEQHEKYNKSYREGQREEIVDPGVLHQVYIVKGSDHGCRENTGTEYLKIPRFPDIDLLPRHVPGELLYRSDRAEMAAEGSPDEENEPDPCQDPDDPRGQGLAGGRDAHDPGKLHRHKRGEEEKAKESTYHHCCDRELSRHSPALPDPCCKNSPEKQVDDRECRRQRLLSEQEISDHLPDPKGEQCRRPESRNAFLESGPKDP